MRELDADISRSFTTMVRSALVTSTTITAKAFSAWHISRLPECYTLVQQELKGADAGERAATEIRRFVHFLFWRLNSPEKRTSGHLRLQMIATIERLQDLVDSGKWKISDDVPLEVVIAKIESLGGVTAVYDFWREQVARLKATRVHQRYEQIATNLGLPVEEVIRRQQEVWGDHQRRKDQEKESRFVEMLSEIAEEVSWRERQEGFMLIAAVRSPRGRLRLFKLRERYARRMITAVVNPTTSID